MQAQQRLEGQAEAALNSPSPNSLEQAAPGPIAGSPKSSPRVLGRTATPARSNLLQLVTDNLDEVRTASVLPILCVADEPLTIDIVRHFKMHFVALCLILH